jgi:hypothetical protein
MTSGGRLWAKRATRRRLVGFCVNENFHEFFVPKPPEAPIGAGVAAQETQRKELHEYDKALRIYQGQYSVAIGILRGLFVFRTKVRNEIDAILDHPPPTPLDENGVAIANRKWTPELAFKAAMKHLKDVYAPSDAVDCASYRQKITDLTDEEEGGFKFYAEKFNYYWHSLKNAGKEPNDEDSSTWVIKGIRNPMVKGVISSLLANRDQALPLPTYRELFRFVEVYLKNMGDSDPYKATKVSPSGTAKVAINATNTSRKEKRCTKCWRIGHVWSDCKAKVCSACNKPFNDMTYCANWESHEDPFKWVPKHRITEEGKRSFGNKRKRSQEDGEGDKRQPEDKSDALQNLQQAKKIYMAARKEYRKKGK